MTIKSGFGTRDYAPLELRSIRPSTPFFKEWSQSVININKRRQIEDK